MPYLNLTDYIHICFAWQNIHPPNSLFNKIPLIFSNGLLYENESNIRPKLYVYINNKIDSTKLIKKFNNILIVNKINSPTDLIKCFKNNNIIEEDIFNIDEDIDLLDIEEIEIDENEDSIPKTENSSNQLIPKNEESSKKINTINTESKTLQNVILNDYSNYISVSKSVAKTDKQNRVLTLIYDTKTNKLFYVNEINYLQKGHHIKAQYYSIHISSYISLENIKQLKDTFNEISIKIINLSNCKNIDEQLLRYLISIIRDYKLIDLNKINENFENNIQIIDENINDNTNKSEKTIKINKAIKERIKQFIIIQTNVAYPIVKPVGFEFKMIFSYQGQLMEINKLNEDKIINKNKTAIKRGLIALFNSTYIDITKFKELFGRLNIRTIEDAYYNIYKHKLIEQCLKEDYPSYNEIIKEFETNYILNEQMIQNEFNLFDINNVNSELVNTLLDTLFTKIHHIEIDIGISLLRINNKKGLIEHLNARGLRDIIDGGIKQIKIVNKQSEVFIFKNSYIMKLLMYKIIEYYQSQNLIN